MRGTKEKQILGRSASKSGEDVHAQNGITLIALIVSIIIMLILAGVSINAVIGDNGIITQAINAKEQSEIASIKEDLEYMFVEYYTGNYEDIGTFLLDKVPDEIDEFKAYTFGNETQIIVSKNGYYFLIEEQSGGYVATLMSEEITTGYVVVTEESFDTSTGTMTFEIPEYSETSVIFYDEISGGLNFDIVSGTVTIYITNDMELTNEELSRSAVDVHEGATLNLYIADGVTMTVDSGYGEEGETATELGAEGGPGGYAGIHVPEGATLNLYGTGTLIAYGGDAGDGGGAVSGNTGGGRRRSEPERESEAMEEKVVMQIQLLLLFL